MATIVPPPSKRQRLESLEKAKQEAEANAIPPGLGSVRVQFIDGGSGNGTGPAVSIPIENSSIKNLEILLNSIQGKVGTHLKWPVDVALTDSSSRTMTNEYPTGSPSSQRI